MIDDHPDPGPDPLAGRDPHPRTQIDLWPLHDARQELLEEIVSQPRPGNAAAPSARRILVPVGIAAAIALVAGGAWFVVSSDDSSAGKDDQVVAASDSPTDTDTDSDNNGGTEVATDPTTADVTTEPAEPAETDEPKRIPISELREGDVLSPPQCRELRRGLIVLGDRSKPPRDIKVKRLETTLEALSYVVLRNSKNGDGRWYVAVQSGKRWIGIDKECTVISVGKFPNVRGHR